MGVITLGPFVLQTNMLALLAGIFIAVAITRYRLRGSAQVQKGIALAMNAVLIAIVVWKLSVFVVQPDLVNRFIHALLYFNGGRTGAYMAVAASLLYIVFELRRQPKEAVHIYLDGLISAALIAASIYMVLQFLIGEGSRVSAAVLAVWFISCTVYILRIPRFVSAQRGIQLAIISIVGAALLHTGVVNGWERVRASLASGEAEQADIGLKKGQLAPDFALELAGGGTAKLSDFQGKTVVVNFWATWCPPCEAEMPYLQQYYEYYEASGAVVLGVNATSTEVSKPVVGSWIKHWGLSFPNVYDINGEVVRQYRVAAFPTTYVINPNGTVKAKHQGPLTFQLLKELAG